MEEGKNKKDTNFETLNLKEKGIQMRKVTSMIIMIGEGAIIYGVEGSRRSA